MTDKCQIHKCRACGEPLDEATQSIVWTEDDVPLCEYCAKDNDDGFVTAFTDGEVCGGCVTDGDEPHAEWCFVNLKPELELDPPPPHKCPFCDTPMSLGDGCYWCDNPNCELKL